MMKVGKAGIVAAMNTLARSVTIADPESADDRKCAEVADDDGWFCEVVHTFLAIMKRYGGEGFSISGRIYK